VHCSDVPPQDAGQLDERGRHGVHHAAASNGAAAGGIAPKIKVKNKAECIGVLPADHQQASTTMPKLVADLLTDNDEEDNSSSDQDETSSDSDSEADSEDDSESDDAEDDDQDTLTSNEYWQHIHAARTLEYSMIV
jgi:cobalamin biosynthesis protein CobT